MFYGERNDVPFTNKDSEDVLIHNDDHGNSGTHEVPYAHDLNIPVSDGEKYLDTLRSLTDEEKYYNDKNK